ncbi:MAG: hypothetical protein LQ339_001004 [Xanthoria mediterranea]|nr:MAG: hypothetical protein LQ339_001004 [Xanthoria mediterranea]
MEVQQMSVFHGAQRDTVPQISKPGNAEKVLPSELERTVSLSEVQATMRELCQQEASVTQRLNALVASQNELNRSLARLDISRATLGSQAVSTRSIGNTMLSNASIAAKRISAAVNRLDLEQARVKDTLHVVEQVAELKTCVLGVTGSMGAAQDWEAAATYLNRASRIPSSVINGSFAEEIVPTSEVPELPKITLEQAAQSLQGLFLREFQRAAAENNGSKVTRFFKLFPLIGKSGVGLDVYGRYVCQGVAARARSNLNAGTGGSQATEGFFYANALTKLFEHVAQIVEHHGGLVELHYGAGSMVRVIERLQTEADIQGGIIIDTWSDERSIDRRLTDIRSYAFTFLVQSFLPAQPARSGTPRAGSPNKRRVPGDSRRQDEEGIDTKGIDTLLSEMTTMAARWSLYCRFIALQCKGSLEDGILKVPSFITTSALNRKIADRITAPINATTTFLLRRSVERAFQLDEQPSGLSLNLAKPPQSHAPYISSAVDDVMYIVNQVVERSLATSQRSVFSSVLPSVTRVLDSDFIGMIQRKMRDECYPKAAVQGALPPENTILAFLVLINDLDVGCDYVRRIVQSWLEGFRRADSSEEKAEGSSKSLDSLYPFEGDALHAANLLKSLQQSFEAKASELIGDGIYVVCKNVVKPRLRPLLADAFRDIDYQMNEEGQAEAKGGIEDDDGSDPGVDEGAQDHFQRGWDALTKPIARIFTNGNSERLLNSVIAYLAEMLEKRIWSYYGRINDYGAIRLERDIAGLVNIVVRGSRYGLRDAFARCTQICLIMNMEEDEWAETQASSTSGLDPVQDAGWVLDGDERARARAMVQSRKG